MIDKTREKTDLDQDLALMKTPCGGDALWWRRFVAGTLIWDTDFGGDALRMGRFVAWTLCSRDTLWRGR